MYSKNYKNLIAKYNSEVEAFDSADGLYNNYVGNENRADGSYSAPSGQGFTKISDGDRLYTVVVTNTNTSGGAVNAIVFGSDLYSGSTQPNPGVTVTVQESSHAQARNESSRSPFWVNGLRYITTTNSQMTSQIPVFYRTSSSGRGEFEPFRPMAYRTAMNNISNQVDADDFQFYIDGSSYIQVPVIANETVTFMLYIGGRVDMGEALKGNSPFKVANQKKLNTGIAGR
jgi:hypothetical protein